MEKWWMTAHWQYRPGILGYTRKEAGGVLYLMYGS